VGEAGNGAEAVACFAEQRPDVTLMDGRLPDIPGCEAARRICELHPGARVIMLSIDETEEHIHAGERSGACGYLPKSTDRAGLLAAIRAVAAGERCFPGAIGARLHERQHRVSLSAREVDVLRLVARGQANKQIADALGLSLFTVKNHLAHILTKLDVPDRTSAVTAAIERGILRAG
jgi:DNA-binding NarL/FixJ family response regulator